MSKLKRVLKTTGKLFLAVVLLGLVVTGILRFYWGRQYESRMVALKATGQPLSPADLQGPPVPEAENAAPVYDELFELMADPVVAKDIEAACKVCYSRGSRPATQDWETARAAMGRLDRVFALISEAQSKPQCRFESNAAVASSANQDVQAQVKQTAELMERQYKRMAGLRAVTRLLCAQALLNAHDGQTQKSVASLEVALKSSDALANNSSLIGYLFASAVVRLTAANTGAALNAGKFSEKQLSELDSALARVDLAKLYRAGLVGERAMVTQRAYEWRKAMPFWAMDATAYLDFMGERIDSAGLTYPQALSRGLISDDAVKTVPKLSIFTRMLAPTVVKSSIAHYTAQADLACCRTALALEAYKAKSGRYPTSLAQLRSKIKWDLPKDPFTGIDLAYKPNGATYTLYSVGPNQKDDGGTPTQGTTTITAPGDIPWTTGR